MKTETGISEVNRKAIAKELAKILADESVLRLKTRNAHWNVEGGDFYEKHMFFDVQSMELDKIIDTVAERMRSIGHYAPASMKTYLGLTHLSEQIVELNDSQGYIKEILMDHESTIKLLRGQIDTFNREFHDSGTSDFITGLMEAHEKMAWILRSHIVLKDTTLNGYE